MNKQVHVSHYIDTAVVKGNEGDSCFLLDATDKPKVAYLVFSHFQLGAWHSLFLGQNELGYVGRGEALHIQVRQRQDGNMLQGRIQARS